MALALTTAQGLIPLTLGDDATVGVLVAVRVLEVITWLVLVDARGVAYTEWTASAARRENESFIVKDSYQR